MRRVETRTTQAETRSLGPYGCSRTANCDCSTSTQVEALQESEQLGAVRGMATPHLHLGPSPNSYATEPRKSFLLHPGESLKASELEILTLCCTDVASCVARHSAGSRPTSGPRKPLAASNVPHLAHSKYLEIRQPRGLQFVRIRSSSFPADALGRAPFARRHRSKLVLPRTHWVHLQSYYISLGMQLGDASISLERPTTVQWWRKANSASKGWDRETMSRGRVARV